MWYTVSKFDIMHNNVRIPAGTIWTAKASNNNTLFQMVELTNINETAEVGTMYVIKSSASEYFTKPTKHLAMAIDESCMIAESVYC